VCDGDLTSAGDYFDYEAHLKRLGLEIRKVPGDGSCFFWCMVLSGLCPDVQHLRNLVANDIDAFQTTEMGIPEGDLEAYIQGVKGEKWADDPEICATANILGVNIIIHYTSKRKPTVVTPDVASDKEIHILYTGTHYDRLVQVSAAKSEADTAKAEQMEEDQLCATIFLFEEQERIERIEEDRLCAARIEQMEADARFARSLQEV
tara:strand:+ start:700 stop:1314 length:615 start_codon:yes stop_codon:yes gene_type:complete